jgi:Rrf2 family transcriptional regulator, iron-sulfur cluster assembly transcription factor
MLYTGRCAYAVRALSRLASTREPLVKLQDLARDEGIPYPFLAKIFNDLVTAGLVRSARGPRGGYALTLDARAISLYDIRAAIDGVQDLEQCVLGLRLCPGDQACALHDTWKPQRAAIERYLRQTTLADAARALAAAIRTATRRRARLRQGSGAVGARLRQGSGEAGARAVEETVHEP